MILVTGATGSFGQAYIKQYENKDRVVALARDWHKLKALDCSNKVIADVRDKERLYEVIRKYEINTVIHAAAIKDVSFCEDNPVECLKTNVIATQNVIDACILANVHKALLISTDKAVLPINVYGTSKKMAEKLWINADRTSMFTKFSVCRYGNVIGSAGSVLPLFKRLLAEKKKLTITDERMTRFWYRMKDALKLVNDSLENMIGGEVFIPKIPSILMTDLVKAMSDEEYEVIGIREGEKLHEYMIAPDEIKGTQGYSSGNNKHFLTIDEIKATIKEWENEI